MADTFTTLWNRLLLRAPAVGAALSQDFVRDAFNQLAERREWSWLIKQSAFYPPALYVTGTVSVTENLNTVTGAGTAFTVAMVGRQFRIGVTYPTYTILEVLSATSLILDNPWTGPTITGSAYQIYQCYFPVPSDFNYFYSVVNQTANYRLWHNITQAELDLADPQRIQAGQTYAVCFYDYSPSYNGTVGAVLQVRGAGPSPVSATSYGYSFPADSIYTIEITTGGAVGVADFKWKQDAGAYTTAVVTSSDALDLSNGVQVYFPAGVYVLGDTFVIRCTADSISGVPRYELWPRPVGSQYVYAYLYVARAQELTDDRLQLPNFIRGDVVLEMALANCARFPGTDNAKNPYYDLNLAKQHEFRAERMIAELEKKDDDVGTRDLRYTNLPFYPAPWLDGSWLQTHAIYPRP